MLTKSDELTLQITQPVDNPLSATWPIQLDWQGDLAGLPPRVEPWCDLSGWELTGQGSFSATATLSAAAVEVQQAKGTLERLHLWGHGLFLDEPAVELTAAGRWQRAGDKIEIPLVGLQRRQLGGPAEQCPVRRQRHQRSKPMAAPRWKPIWRTIGRWMADPRTATPLPLVGPVGGQGRLVDQGSDQSRHALRHDRQSASRCCRRRRSGVAASGSIT